MEEAREDLNKAKEKKNFEVRENDNEILECEITNSHYLGKVLRLISHRMHKSFHS